MAHDSHLDSNGPASAAHASHGGGAHAAGAGAGASHPRFDDALRSGNVALMALALLEAGAAARDGLVAQIQAQHGNAVANDVLAATRNPLVLTAMAATGQRAGSAPSDDQVGKHASSAHGAATAASPGASEQDELWPGQGGGGGGGGGFGPSDLLPYLTPALFMDRDASRIAFGPVFDKLRERESIKAMVGDRDPVSDGVGDVLADLANDPLFMTAFLSGSALGGYQAGNDFLQAPTDLAKQAYRLVKIHVLEGDLAIVRHAASAVSDLIKAAPGVAAWFKGKWADPNPVARGGFQGKVTGYCVVTLALTVAAGYEGPLALAPEFAFAIDLIKQTDVLGQVTKLIRPLAAAEHLNGAAALGNVPDHAPGRLPHAPDVAPPHASGHASTSGAMSHQGERGAVAGDGIGHRPPTTIGEVAEQTELRSPSSPMPAREVERPPEPRNSNAEQSTIVDSSTLQGEVDLERDASEALEPVRRANTTRTGVKRQNTADWRKIVKTWDEAGYGEALSASNRTLIKNGRTPIVDDEWISYFPGDESLRGEKITIHHIKGSPLNVPLPTSRHIDAHMPGGFKNNPGNPGMTGALAQHGAPIYA